MQGLQGVSGNVVPALLRTATGFITGTLVVMPAGKLKQRLAPAGSTRQSLMVEPVLLINVTVGHCAEAVPASNNAASAMIAVAKNSAADLRMAVMMLSPV